MMWKYNIRRQQIILHLKNYLKSEEFIFDIVVIFFVSIFDYLVPNSRYNLYDILGHSPKNEYFVVMAIQFIIGFNMGRYGQKISNSKKKGCLNTVGFFLIFFLWLFSMNFIEQDESRGTDYLVLTILTSILAIVFGIMWGMSYEKNFMSSEKENKKRIEIFIRVFLIIFSYSVLMLYQSLEIEDWNIMATMDTNTESIGWVLFVTILTGILPYRILLLLEPPVSFFGVFMGIAVIFFDLFF